MEEKRGGAENIHEPGFPGYRSLGYSKVILTEHESLSLSCPFL